MKKKSPTIKEPTESHSRPDIFGYHDYRDFLKDWLEYLKHTKPRFSIRSLAREAKLASGYLPMVLSGSRKLSEKAWSKIAKHIELNSQERTYFEILRVVADADTHEVRKEAFDRLQKFSSFQEANPNELEIYRYLTHWYYVAIRELALLPDFVAEARWIQSKLKGRPTLKEVEQALEFLVDYGYFEILPNKKVKLRERDINCDGGVFRLALTQFHREMLTLAADSLVETKREKRTIGGHTLAIPSKHYGKIKRILDNALKEVAALEPFDEEVDSVYHVTLAAYPVAE